MTATPDPDRLLGAWLDLMPDEAPDRAVSAVLQATERMPQLQRPLVGLRWRIPMKRPSILAGAAVITVVVTVAALLLRPGSNVGPPVTPSPAQSPSEPFAYVPPELRYAWLGELRNVPGLPTDRSILNFDERSMTYLDSFRSRVAAPSTLWLELDADHPATGCKAGDVGSYGYYVSPGGSTLMLLPGGPDACAARYKAIADEWFRSNCLNTENFCLGPLESREYPSYFIAPRLADDAEWAPEFGAIRYTVPDGWAATADWPRDYFLEPADWYAENRGQISAETRGIYVGSHVAALQPGESCYPGLAEGVQRSADAIASWLAEHPALDAAPPVSITIDGVSGAYVDGAMSPASDEVCRSAPTPVAVLFGEDGRPAGGRAWGAQEGHQARWILLDLEPGRPLLIMITAREELFDDLLAEAMPIVESFRFE